MTAVSLRKDGPPFRRVLVANRGEIAVRVMRACRELGIESVAAYSDADLDAAHVRAADHSVRLGPAPAAESYLSIERIVRAAVASRADAVHPGYGFLSERAEFARACEAAGVVFVGPSADAIEALGDKLMARRAAKAARVPVVPGTSDPVPLGDAASLARVREEAQAVGWPLLIKAAAGGGGRGMRRVDAPGDLETALLAASSEAAAAFGDGSVYLERFVEGARHVEVQLLGDKLGHLVALGERDCSVQRRHQKLVEEAPAPNLSRERRRELHENAIRVAQAVGLYGAATAEFLLTPAGEFWFLEVNARLQVEHGVTELVTGVDLVHEQLRIAAGRPLSARTSKAAASAADTSLHAIEVRLSAEDPGNDFAPSPGTLTEWQEPGGPGVRVDTWVEAGTSISPHYDPLMAKILVVAEDRGGALARLSRALREVRVGGVQTTLPFHLWLADEPGFMRADLRTDFVALHWEPEKLRSEARAAAAAAAAAPAAAGPPPPNTAASDTVVSVPKLPYGGGWDHRSAQDPAQRWRVAGRYEALGRDAG